MTDLEAVVQLIKEESTITGLLGVFTGTTEPIVVVGAIPEDQNDDDTNLPAISIHPLAKDTVFGITTSRITVSCYAKSENESAGVASAVNEYFRDSQGGVNGFSAKFESVILGTTNNGDEAGTNVELKLEYR